MRAEHNSVRYDMVISGIPYKHLPVVNVQMFAIPTLVKQYTQIDKN